MKPAPIARWGADDSMARHAHGSLDLISLGKPGRQVQGNCDALKYLRLWAPLEEKIWVAASLLLPIPELV